MKKGLFLTLISVLLIFLYTKAWATGEIEACVDFLKAQDYQRAIKAGERATRLYSQSPDAFFCLGRAYYEIGEFKKALTNLKTAESLTNDKESLSHIYNVLGVVYQFIGDLDNALFYFNKALSIVKELKMRDVEGTILNNIAYIHQSKDEDDKALRYYEESLALKTDELSKASTYNNIASIYSKKGDFNKALEYYQKSLEIAERHGDYHKASIYMINIGDTYREIKDFEKSEKYLLEGLQRVKKVGDKYWEGSAYVSLGWLYRDLGKKEQAIEYLTKAYKLFKAINAKLEAEEVHQELLGLGINPEETKETKPKVKK